jgi:hypothetical protein
MVRELWPYEVGELSCVVYKPLEGQRKEREHTVGKSHGSLSICWCQVLEVSRKFQTIILQVHIFYKSYGMGTYCLAHGMVNA